MAGLQVGDLIAVLRLQDSLTPAIRAAQAAAQSAFAGMQQSSSAATGAMSQTQTRLKADLKAVEDQIKQLEETSKSGYITQTKGLESARLEADKLRDMIGRLGTAMHEEAAAAAAAAGATDRHRQSQESDEQATRRRGQALQDVANGMRAAGDALTIGVSAPLLAATAASIHFASAFETNTTRLVTLSGVSEENMQRMSKAMLDMAPAVGVGPGELSRAMLAVTSTGIRGAEAIDILRIAAKASAVGLGDTEIVARTVVSAVNAYGASNLSAAHAADILYRTVVAGNAEAATLAPVLGRVTGIAAQIGISFEEVGASIATFTRLGVGADVAVTGLRDVLVHLLSPSKEAAKAFAEYGLSAAGLRAELRDKGLMETLQHLMQVTGGNVDVMSDMIGDVRGLALVLGTAGAQADTYAQVLDEIKNGTMGVDDAHKRMKATAGQIWKEIEAQIEVVFVTFGQQLLPVLKELAPSLKNLLENVLAVVKAFADLPQPVQTFLEAMLALGIVGGPVLSGLGRLLDMWIKIRGAIAAAATMELPGWLAGMLARAGLGGGAVAVAGEIGTAAAAGGIIYGSVGDGTGNLLTRTNPGGQNPNAQFTAPDYTTNVLPFVNGSRPGGVAGYAPRTSGAEVDQLLSARGALGPMGNAGTGMVAGTNVADIVGGLTAVTTGHEKASAAAKAHATHLEEYANAAKDYTTVVAQLGDDLYEGIAYDHARGVSTAALADVYKVSETTIKDVVDAEKTAAAEKKEQLELQKLIATETAKYEKNQDKLDDEAAKRLHAKTDQIAADMIKHMPRQIPGLNDVRSVMGPDGVMRTLAPGLISDPSHGTGVGPGMQAFYQSQPSFGDAVHGTLHDLPGIMQQAFTGGGGLGGAAQAMGVDFGTKLFDKGGAVNTVMQKGIGAIFDPNGAIGKMLGDAIPVVGAMVGPLMTAIIGHFHKPEWKKAMKDVGRDYGVNISDGLAQAIEKTEKSQHVGRNEATLLHLKDIIGEDGGLDAGNLGKYEAKLRDVFVDLQTHTMTAAQATKVLDDNFAAFATAATDKTGLLDDKMRELIRLNQQAGTESKAIAQYLKAQAADVASGFTKVALGFTKPIQDAYDKLQALKGDGKSGREHDDQVRQAEEHLRSVTSPEAFGRQGELASLTIANQRASGMGLVESYNAIGPALDKLAEVQKTQHLAPSDDLQHLLALRGIIAANPELFGAMDGLKGMATGLANSNQMTPAAFATIASEVLQNVQNMEGLGLSHADAMDTSKETLQVLYELQKRDPSLQLTPEMQKLLDEAKDAGLVGDKQLSAAERQVSLLDGIKGRLGDIRDVIGRAFGIPVSAMPGTPGAPGTPTAPGSLPDVGNLPGGVVVPGGSHEYSGDMGDGIHAMAGGGDFLVRKPTLFLAGEAGLERATFSGAGKTGAMGAPQVNQYTSYAVTVIVKDNDRAQSFKELMRQEGVEVLVEEIEDGRQTMRLERALEAVRRAA